MTEMAQGDPTKPSFLIRKTNQSFKILNKSFLDFYSILANFSKTHPLRLNIPETVLFGYSIPRPTLIKTTSDHLIAVRENISSPE